MLMKRFAALQPRTRNGDRRLRRRTRLPTASFRRLLAVADAATGRKTGARDRPRWRSEPENRLRDGPATSPWPELETHPTKGGIEH